MQQEIANFQAKTAPLWERLSIYEYREREFTLVDFNRTESFAPASHRNGRSNSSA